MIALENFEAAFLLHVVMLTLRAPSHDRFFVSPGRQRKNAAFSSFTAETFVVDKAVHGLQDGLQMLCPMKIFILAFFPRVDFEDHRKHGGFLGRVIGDGIALTTLTLCWASLTRNKHTALSQIARAA